MIQVERAAESASLSTAWLHLWTFGYENFKVAQTMISAVRHFCATDGTATRHRVCWSFGVSLLPVALQAYLYYFLNILSFSLLCFLGINVSSKSALLSSVWYFCIHPEPFSNINCSSSPSLLYIHVSYGKQRQSSLCINLLASACTSNLCPSCYSDAFFSYFAHLFNTNCLSRVLLVYLQNGLVRLYRGSESILVQTSVLFKHLG